MRFKLEVLLSQLGDPFRFGILLNWLLSDIFAFERMANGFVKFYAFILVLRRLILNFIIFWRLFLLRHLRGLVALDEIRSILHQVLSDSVVSCIIGIFSIS